MKTVFFILVSLAIFSCSLSESEINRDWYKYGSGYHIGDQLRSLKDMVRNDTIFKSNKPVATIHSTVSGYFGSSDKIIIKSLFSEKLGYYHYKGN